MENRKFTSTSSPVPHISDENRENSRLVLTPESGRHSVQTSWQHLALDEAKRTQVSHDACHRFSYRNFHGGADTARNVTYTSLVDRCIDGSDGANLFRVDPAHLTKSNSLISVATDSLTDAVVAGAHAVADGAFNIWFQGVATDPAYRRLGVGRTVFALAIVKSTVAYNSTSYRLSVRERGGVPAPEAFALYESFGFRVVDRCKIAISGGELDAHHRKFAEGDKMDHFFVLQMAAGYEAMNIASEHLVKRFGGEV